MPTPYIKPGDTDLDNDVDNVDYEKWLSFYLAPTINTSNGATVGDFNNDTKVDGIDYVIWMNNYGK